MFGTCINRCTVIKGNPIYSFTYTNRCNLCDRAWVTIHVEHYIASPNVAHFHPSIRRRDRCNNVQFFPVLDATVETILPALPVHDRMHVLVEGLIPYPENVVRKDVDVRLRLLHDLYLEVPRGPLAYLGAIYRHSSNPSTICDISSTCASSRIGSS